MRLETRTSIAKNDIVLRMTLTYFLLFTQDNLGKRHARPYRIQQQPKC